MTLEISFELYNSIYQKTLIIKLWTLNLPFNFTSTVVIAGLTYFIDRYINKYKKYEKNMIPSPVINQTLNNQQLTSIADSYNRKIFKEISKTN